MEYRQRAKRVDAMQWDGENEDAIVKWSGGGCAPVCDQPGGNRIWVQRASYGSGGSDFLVMADQTGGGTVMLGDYIVKSANGELSVMSPNVFEATYEVDA